MPSPEAVAFISSMKSQMPAPGAPVPTFEDQRRQTSAMFGAMSPLPDEAVAADVSIGNMPARWLDLPESSLQRVVLYLHGGGHVVGGIDSHQGLAARIGRSAHARVLIPDFRLAPEDPFPAGLDDALQAYLYLLDSGYDTARISIVGDSSGGGLTAALLILLREREVDLPAAAVLLSPWIDLTLSGKSITELSDVDPLLTSTSLDLWAHLYAGATDRAHHLISPLAADLTGLPPVLIQAGTAELLKSDSEMFAAHLSACGVEVTLELEDDLFHAYQLFPMLPESIAAVDRIGVFLTQRT